MIKYSKAIVFPYSSNLTHDKFKVPKDAYYRHLRIMHDEVSETENIRKNLAIERMIVEGCEVLLDTSQTFVRQGEARETARPHTETPSVQGSFDLRW